MQTNRHNNVKFAYANRHKNVVFDNSIIDDVLAMYNTNVETLLDTEFYGCENTFFVDDITADYRCMNYFIWKNVLYNLNRDTFGECYPKEIDYIYKYAYHITTKEKYENLILNKGLIPKRNLEYSGRVYLFSENTSKKDILSFFRLKARICNIDDKPILLKIDIENMRKTGRDISLFADPAFNRSNAMFTMEPIPFKYISIEEI